MQSKDPTKISNSLQNGTCKKPNFEEDHRPELVRLLLQTLQSLGYWKSMEQLQLESGVPLQGQHIRNFQSAILEGEWDKVFELLPDMIVVEDKTQQIRSLIYQQMFLEHLEVGERTKALQLMHNSLTPIVEDPTELHKLASLVMCKDTQTLYKKSNWDGKNGSSRIKLIKSLQGYISSDQLLQEDRLYTLLQQAQEYQKRLCLYHNTSQTKFSLLQDHQCDKTSLPQYTRCVLRTTLEEVWFVAFSHSGKFLAAGGKGPHCLIFDAIKWTSPDVKTGDNEAIMTLNGHTNIVSHIAWSPNDTYIATCSNDCTCRVWNPLTGECIYKFSRHTEAVIAAAWYPCNKTLVTASHDKCMYKWDITGRVRGRHTGIRVNDIAISQDSKVMVTVDSDRRLIHYNLVHPVDKMMEHDPQRSYTPNSRERHDDSDGGLDSDNEEDPTSPTSVYKTIHKSCDALTSLCLSDDSKYVLVNKAVNEKRGSIHLYDIQRRPFKVMQKFTGHLQKRYVIRSCFGGPDQSFVLSGSEDSKVYVYHRETGRKLLSLTGHTNVVNSVSWNPVYYNMFASASDDGVVRVWTTEQPNGVVEDEEEDADGEEQEDENDEVE